MKFKYSRVFEEDSLSNNSVGSSSSSFDEDEVHCLNNIKTTSVNVSDRTRLNLKRREGNLKFMEFCVKLMCIRLSVF